MIIPANSLTSVRKVKSLEGLFSVYADRAQLPEREHPTILTEIHPFRQYSALVEDCHLIDAT
jgi:hypothetical protein